MVTHDVPSQPVTLSVEQIEELNQKLSNMRHDINNNLSLILAATELIRHKPQSRTHDRHAHGAAAQSHGNHC